MLAKQRITPDQVSREDAGTGVDHLHKRPDRVAIDPMPLSASELVPTDDIRNRCGNQKKGELDHSARDARPPPRPGL